MLRCKMSAVPVDSQDIVVRHYQPGVDSTADIPLGDIFRMEELYLAKWRKALSNDDDDEDDDSEGIFG